MTRFFDDLNIPKPDANFGCGGGSQAERTAAIMIEFEKELFMNPADYVLVVGDVNIAFMNELAKTFNAMEIDTHDVIEAAASKWNFIKLNPGLVGGHYISVDPYYLIQKALVYGFLPRVMFAARRLNDGMGAYVATQVIKCMNKKGIVVKDAEILIMGVTFKKNCPDIRNTKIVDIYHTLEEYTTNITVYDPWVNSNVMMREYGIMVANQLTDLHIGRYDAVVLAVALDQFKNLNLHQYLRIETPGVIYDVMGCLPKDIIDVRL